MIENGVISTCGYTGPKAKSSTNTKRWMRCTRTRS